MHLCESLAKRQAHGCISALTCFERDYIDTKPTGALTDIRNEQSLCLRWYELTKQKGKERHKVDVSYLAGK